MNGGDIADAQGLWLDLGPGSISFKHLKPCEVHKFWGIMVTLQKLLGYGTQQHMAIVVSLAPLASVSVSASRYPGPRKRCCCQCAGADLQGQRAHVGAQPAGWAAGG